MNKRVIAWILILVLVFSVVCRAGSLTVQAWYTPQEEETSSLDIALEQFAENEYWDPNSTYNTIIEEKLSDLRRVIAQIKWLVDEDLPEGLYIALNDLSGLLEDLAEIFDTMDKVASGSAHDHESIEAFWGLIEIYDYLAQVYDDVTDAVEILNGWQISASWADLSNGLIQLLRYLLLYGRDFMLTPEYIEWANGFDPWWLEAIDERFEIQAPYAPYEDAVPYRWDIHDAGELDIRIPPGANSLKPNIYLYGPEGTEFTLTFDEPGLLTTVIPEYGNSWEVVLEDGSMTVDGVPGYDFLFYESLTSQTLMQTESAYVVEPENRTEQFEEILRETGFEENEILDFLEYWVDKLDPYTTYVMYPQDTETVDIAMPITLEGEEIESYYRIWYYFVPYEGQSVTEPEIAPVQHQGVTLIEWGGVLDE